LFHFVQVVDVLEEVDAPSLSSGMPRSLLWAATEYEATVSRG